MCCAARQALLFRTAKQANSKTAVGMTTRRTVRFERGVTATFVALGLLLAGCAAPPEAARYSIVLLDPTAPLGTTWQHSVFGRATDYSLATVDGRPGIRAVGRSSASGLYRRVRFASAECSWIEWTWRVDRLQASADIRIMEADDVAASIFLLFGDPGPFHDEVPTLRYAWTNSRVAAGEILDNPYYPGTVRVVVLRSGDSPLGEWVSERRNLVEDFTRAFGRAPPETVEVSGVQETDRVLGQWPVLQRRIRERTRRNSICVSQFTRGSPADRRSDDLVSDGPQS